MNNMKAVFGFLTLLFLLGQNTWGQTVFAPQGAMWNYYRDGEPPVYNNKYMVEKDTLYEGHTCSKVIGYKILADGTKTNYEPNYFYTSGDTVLYYHDSLKSFTPLYIFDVTVGDTLTYAAPTWYYKSIKSLIFIVTKIDTSNIDGISLRNIYTRGIYPYGSWTDKYTERIGGYRIGNIIAYTGPTTADHTLGIRCYHDKEIDEKFVSDKWDCDFVPTSIVEKGNPNDIQIFPNPANRFININLNTSRANGTAFLFSLEGKLLVQKELNEPKTQIDIHHLTKGIYLLQIKNETETFSKLIMLLD
jgi:hypothetical protein